MGRSNVPSTSVSDVGETHSGTDHLRTGLSPNHSDTGTVGVTVEVAVEWCVVALLENPREGEVTSPGMCLEVRPKIKEKIIKIYNAMYNTVLLSIVCYT